MLAFLYILSRLDASISSLLSGIDSLADEARAAAVTQANEDNFVVLVQQAFYVTSYLLYVSKSKTDLRLFSFVFISILHH